MLSLLGSFQQAMHVLFLVRYLVLQPVWVGFKGSGLSLLIDSVLALLGTIGNRLPFE